MYEKIDINREFPPYATVNVKVAGEKLFTFEGLSSRITERHLKLILPALLDSEREKRAKKAAASERRKVNKERKAELAALWEVVDDGPEEEQRNQNTQGSPEE